jgi:hypothetical protein
MIFTRAGASATTVVDFSHFVNGLRVTQTAVPMCPPVILFSDTNFLF